MAQCAAKLRDGKPCKIPAREGQKYCHIHHRQRIWRLIFSGAALGVLGVIANVAGILNFFGITFPSLYHTRIPTSTILPLMQTQIISPTATPKGRLYMIEFVAGPIPADGELHNVYFSVDDGVEQYLFTAGTKVDHQFYVTFSRSIQVRVAIRPGTVLYEELYVNGEKVASKYTDNSGLTYQAH